jgi:hypothetical protein
MSLGEYVARKNAEVERLRADRRERIATACLAGLLSYNRKGSFEDFAADAVDYADALIARLDKEAAP